MPLCMYASLAVKVLDQNMSAVALIEGSRVLKVDV